MTSDERKNLIIKKYDALAVGDVDAFDEIYAHDVILNWAGFPPLRGLEVYKEITRQWVAAFDVTHIPLEILCDGDKVILYERYQLLHKGEFLGVPATGKVIEMEGVDINWIVGGKIIVEWAVQDRLSLMRELGIENADLIQQAGQVPTGSPVAH